MTRHRYTGKEWNEETGLAYHGTRYYALWLGRWTAADPIGIGDGVNLYGYVQNNPLVYVDSSGQSKHLNPGEELSSEDQEALHLFVQTFF